tara:strand:- start:1232 stop:1411 length:180 start_codon:yes stop_codon:yes gene_type:complete
MDDLVAYDFSLDNIVSVKAPKGVDPATLHEQLRVRLQEILDTKDEGFIFEGNFTGENDG